MMRIKLSKVFAAKILRHDQDGTSVGKISSTLGRLSLLHLNNSSQNVENFMLRKPLTP